MANTQHLAADDTYPLVPGDDGYDALDDLWLRLARPFEVTATVAALTGISPKEVRKRVGAALALSTQAEALLDQFPYTIRSLATSMKSQAERCVGELRGPVLWSETMSARASTFGANDVFVCSTPSRAYDIDENQVLKWALKKLSDAAEDALEGESAHVESQVFRRVRRNGNDAARFAEHPSMARVSLRRPNMRTLKRTRSGKKAKAYLPAIDFIALTLEPVNTDFVRTLADDYSTRQHRLLMEVVHTLEDRTDNRLPEFRIEQGALYAGPVQYHNSHRLPDGKILSGIVVGQLLIDVPEDPDQPLDAAEAELAARAGSRRTRIATTPEQVAAAVDYAVELARTP